MNFTNLFVFMLILNAITTTVIAFIPARFLNYVLSKLNKFHDNFGQVGRTYTHEEIIKRGNF